MTVFKAASTLTTSDPGLYDAIAVGAASPDFAYETFPDDTNAVLVHGYLDPRGNIVEGPDTVATYAIPDTDPDTNATFDNSYSTFAIDNSVHALFYTTSAHGSYGPSDQTKLNIQEFDDDGNQILGPTSLVLNGKTATKDLYAVEEGARADFGNTFTVVYSTFDPTSGKGQLAFEQFDDSGDPLNGAVLQNFNDGGHHGLNFGTFYTSDSATPDYLLLYRKNNSNELKAALYSTDMQQMVSTTVVDTGPDGEAATSLDRYGYINPGTGKSNYGVLSQTFQYTDASGTAHEEIGLETIDPQTLKVQASTQFEDVNGTHTGVNIQHLANGNIAVAYVDGTQTYLKEFNQSLQQVGKTFTVPHDSNGGFDTMVSAGGNSVELFWREVSDPGSSNISVQHSQVFKV